MISEELFCRVKDNLNQAAKGPYCIDLIISNSCNLKCKYCWAGKRPEREDYLPEEVLTRFLNSAKDLQVKEISLTSTIGEPTLFKNITSLMQKIKAHGFLGSLLTNGSLLDLNFARLLKQIHWDVLILSVDSFNPLIQHSLRPGINQREYLNGLLEFLQYCRQNCPGLCLNLNMVVNSLNYRDVQEYFKQAEVYGVRNITLLKLVKMNENYSELALTKTQLAEFMKIIEKMRTPVSFNYREWLPEPGQESPAPGSLTGPKNASKHCYYHLYKMLIDHDGQVIGCNGDASVKTGFNIKAAPLKEIYSQLVKLYLPYRNNPKCYEICCSPIKTMNQEIDFCLSHPASETKPNRRNNE